MESVLGEGGSKSKLFCRAVVRKYWCALPSVAVAPQ